MTKTNIQNKMKKILLLIPIVFVSINTQAQEISDTSFGKGLVNFVAKDSTFSVKFAPRFQVRSMSSWDHNGDIYESPEHNFIVRRARLKFDGFAYNKNLIYKTDVIEFIQHPNDIVFVPRGYLHTVCNNKDTMGILIEKKEKYI